MMKTDLAISQPRLYCLPGVNQCPMFFKVKKVLLEHSGMAYEKLQKSKRAYKLE